MVAYPAAPCAPWSPRGPQGCACSPAVSPTPCGEASTESCLGDNLDRVQALHAHPWQQRPEWRLTWCHPKGRPCAEWGAPPCIGKAIDRRWGSFLAGRWAVSWQPCKCVQEHA